MIEVSYLELKQAAYKPVWDLQEQILANNLSIKKNNKNTEENTPTINALIFCEHKPVYTLGKSGDIENLKLNKTELANREIDYWHINRGGDITYHGPGQITGYPVFDLECFKPSASWFIDTMENAIIDTLNEFGIESQRIDGLTGVWVKGATAAEDRKICAIGVKMSRYVSIHGFALNVCTDLEYFNHIVPCGIDDKGVTSMEKELGRKVGWHEVAPVLREYFQRQFAMQTKAINLQKLENQIARAHEQSSH